MIITEQVNKEQSIFIDILNKSHHIIDEEAKTNPAYYMKRNANLFENDVYDAICEAAKKTDFENTIELISGHKFPDIVAKKFYGVEVKTTKQDHWKSTGNSVLETTRIENVERIYIFFAKLSNPIGFKYRKYQDCLYDVAVTHSPRYLIDMNLSLGNTIFEKLKIPYDELRNLKNPIKPIVDYYRSISKNGEEPWWMDTGESSDTLVKPTVTLWSHLDVEIKNNIRNEVMALFPEIFSKSSSKYQRVASWLAARYGVVDSSLRDRFSAGGQVTIKIDNRVYKKIPKIFEHLKENINDVISIVKKLTVEDAKYHWKLDTNPGYKKLINVWIEKIIEHSSESLINSRVFIIHLLKDALGEENTSLLLMEEIKKYGID